MMACEKSKNQFIKIFEKATFYNSKPETASETWEQLRNTIQTAGKEAFGEPKTSNKDWF